VTARSAVAMSSRAACVTCLLAAACGAPTPAKDATRTTAGGAASITEPAHFAWKAPLTVHVTEDATKNGNAATVSYWLDVCPKAPDLLVVTHRDFRFVTLLGKPASNPEFSATLAEITPLTSAIPRFVVDAQGKVIAVEGVPELIARLRAAFPGAAVDQVAQRLEDPAAAQAINASANERWQVWVQAWLATDPRTIAPQDIINPHRVKLTQASQAQNISDPSGSGAKLDLAVELTTDTEWPSVRPWVATSSKKAKLTLNGESATRSETHRYTFDWNGPPDAAPKCAQ